MRRLQQEHKNKDNNNSDHPLTARRTNGDENMKRTSIFVLGTYKGSKFLPWTDSPMMDEVF